MTDPAIIEAAIAVWHDKYGWEWPATEPSAGELFADIITAVTPMILEQAAKVADDYVSRREIDAGEDIAAAIRALKEQP